MRFLGADLASVAREGLLVREHDRLGEARHLLALVEVEKGNLLLEADDCPLLVIVVVDDDVSVRD